MNALEVIERLSPDVVLLDVQLPDIDGFEVAARAAAFDSPPVISAHLESRRTRLPLADLRLRRRRLHREGRALGRGHGSPFLVAGRRGIGSVQGGASLVAAGCALALALTSNHSDPSALDALLGELVGLSFTTAGLLGTWRRPGLPAASFPWSASPSSPGALAFANASAAVEHRQNFAGALPRGVRSPPARLPDPGLTRGAKRVVVFAYASAIGFPTTYLLVAADHQAFRAVQPSAFTIVDGRSA